MHCEQAEMLIPQYIFNELTADDMALVSAHLATCESCTQSCKELKEASSFLESALKAPNEKKFSEEKRQQLLTAFKELKPIELAEAKKEVKKSSSIDTKTFFTSLAAILLVMVGLSGLVPFFLSPKERYRKTTDSIIVTQKINDMAAYKSETGEYPFDYVISEEAVDRPTRNRIQQSTDSVIAEDSNGKKLSSDVKKLSKSGVEYVISSLQKNGKSTNHPNNQNHQLESEEATLAPLSYDTQGGISLWKDKKDPAATDSRTNKKKSSEFRNYDETVFPKTENANDDYLDGAGSQDAGYDKKKNSGSKRRVRSEPNQVKSNGIEDNFDGDVKDGETSIATVAGRDIKQKKIIEKESNDSEQGQNLREILEGPSGGQEYLEVRNFYDSKVDINDLKTTTKGEVDKKELESYKNKEIDMLMAEMLAMQETSRVDNEIINKLKNLEGNGQSSGFTFTNEAKNSKKSSKISNSAPHKYSEEVTGHAKTENKLEGETAEGAEEGVSDTPQLGSGLQGGIGGGNNKSAITKKRVEFNLRRKTTEYELDRGGKERVENPREQEAMNRLNEASKRLSVKEVERLQQDRTPIIEDKMSSYGKRQTEEKSNNSTKTPEEHQRQNELQTLQSESKAQNETLKKQIKKLEQENEEKQYILDKVKSKLGKDIGELYVDVEHETKSHQPAKVSAVEREKISEMIESLKAEESEIKSDDLGTLNGLVKDEEKLGDVSEGAGYLSDVRRLDDYNARGVISKHNDSSKNKANKKPSEHKLNEYEIPFQDIVVYPAEWEEFVQARKPEVEIGKEHWRTTILERLEQPVFFDFTKKGLRDGLNELSDLTGLTIAFDRNLFNDKGIDPEAPIQMVANGMTAKNALKWILANANADYSLVNQAIYITPKGQIVGETKINTYSVLDILNQPKSFFGPDIAPDGKTSITESKKTELNTELNLDANNLKELIEGKIARDTWDEAKGTSIEVFQGKLIINHTEEVQKQVEAFLEELRESAANTEVQQDEEEEVVDVAPVKVEPKRIMVNPFVNTAADSLSTFSIDTDSASYYVCRQNLLSGVMPHESVVRPEEFINAFDYNYHLTSQKTFATTTDCMRSPLNPNLHILKVGIKGKVLGRDGRKPVHVVLVVDTSGSMAKETRLPMVKKGIEKLVTNMQKGDRISLVTYGSDATLNLEYVPIENIDQIQAAVESLKTGGSTDLAKGVMVGYQIAATHFKKGAMNQVMICSDGVANVGNLEADKIIKKVEAYKKQGVSFTSIGFGSGDYNDQLLVKLALRGDGFYYYVNSAEDVNRVFENEIGASFSVIAKDVKLQVSFNENRVLRYRLIGYEAREVKDKDFRNNAVDGGEIISGKSVTAIYELELAKAETAKEFQESLGTVTVRFQNVENNQWEEDAVAITGKIQEVGNPKENPYFYLAYCAATFAEIMRKSPYVKPNSIGQIEGYVQKIADELVLNDQVKDLLRNIHAYEKLSDK